MFTQDLCNGKKAEKEFAQILINQGKKVMITEGLNKDFDIATYEDMTLIDTFEVKEDFIHKTTGNIAFEYECSGKPSGLASTKAKWWVVKTGDKFKVYEVEKLKERLRMYWKDLTTVMGGDNNASKMILIKPQYLDDICVYYS